MRGLAPRMIEEANGFTSGKPLGRASAGCAADASSKFRNSRLEKDVAAAYMDAKLSAAVGK